MSTALVAAPTRRKLRPLQIVGYIASVLIVVGIFVFAIPKFADYGAVWKAITTLTPLEMGSLFAAMIFNLFTYWWANMAALQGLTLWRAAVLTQTTTSIANTLPAGGAIAVGLTYTILKSWGYTGETVALYVGATGLWNIFTKLALPVLSLPILVLTGSSGAAYITAALIGVGVLATAVALLWILFSSERGARKVGEWIGALISALRRPFRRPPLTTGPDHAAQFRSDTINLVRDHWLRLTFFTILSQLALYLVLLLALRHMGVSEHEVGASRVFAVYAFSRLLGAVPITPGGAGLIDIGYIGGLTAAGGNDAQVVAAVLLFRLLTFGVQIPIGAFTYLIWRAKKNWRHPVESEVAPGTVETAT